MPESTRPLLGESSAAGLTSSQVERFRAILRREYGEAVSPEVAWQRAIEVVALFRQLLAWDIQRAASTSSNIQAVDETPRASN